MNTIQVLLILTSLLVGICLSMNRHSPSPAFIPPSTDCQDVQRSLAASLARLERSALDQSALIGQLLNITTQLQKEVTERKPLASPVPTTPVKKVVAVVKDGTNCPAGWVDYPYGDFCYFIQATKMLLSWDAAFLECHNKGAKLVHVGTNLEFRFLKIYLDGIYNSIKNGTQNGWLIGSRERSVGTRKGSYGGSCKSFEPALEFNFSHDSCDKKLRQFICEI